jgi:Spy/CpxP family protein refolding chaperone
MKHKWLTKGAPVVLLLVLVLGMSTAAWARRGCGPMNLTPEQAGQLFDLRQQFMNDTASIRKAMWMKRAEMAVLWKAEIPDQAQIKAKQKEMNALREQMQEKMVAFRIQVRKIAPLGPGKGMGMGPGACLAMMGEGPGPGPMGCE